MYTIIPKNVTGVFEGTYKIPLNDTITVNQPIYENLVTYSKTELISQIVGYVTLLMTIFGILGFISYFRKARRKFRKSNNQYSNESKYQPMAPSYIYPNGNAILRINFYDYATILNARFNGIDSTYISPKELHPGYDEIHIYFPNVTVTPNAHYSITLLIRRGRRRFIYRVYAIGGR
ncbi:DUF973 family protein [Sulfolobus tengchongensis]|uniref:DUF973 family protein n=1 Tax=Sulfolobus tengchongensis TaxID=207809 RepID=A0AAX4L634_9CREN